MSPSALNYDATAGRGNASYCIEPVSGCTDWDSINYDPLANVDDGTCIAEDLETLEGCVAVESNTNANTLVSYAKDNTAAFEQMVMDEVGATETTYNGQKVAGVTGGNLTSTDTSSDATSASMAVCMNILVTPSQSEYEFDGAPGYAIRLVDGDTATASWPEDPEAFKASVITAFENEGIDMTDVYVELRNGSIITILRGPLDKIQAIRTTGSQHVVNNNCYHQSQAIIASCGFTIGGLPLGQEYNLSAKVNKTAYAAKVALWRQTVSNLGNSASAIAKLEQLTVDAPIWAGAGLVIASAAFVSKPVADTLVIVDGTVADTTPTNNDWTFGNTGQPLSDLGVGGGSDTLAAGFIAGAGLSPGVLAASGILACIVFAGITFMCDPTNRYTKKIYRFVGIQPLKDIGSGGLYHPQIKPAPDGPDKAGKDFGQRQAKAHIDNVDYIVEPRVDPKLPPIILPEDRWGDLSPRSWTDQQEPWFLPETEPTPPGTRPTSAGSSLGRRSWGQQIEEEWEDSEDDEDDMDSGYPSLMSGKLPTLQPRSVKSAPVYTPPALANVPSWADASELWWEEQSPSAGSRAATPLGRSTYGRTLSRTNTPVRLGTPAVKKMSSLLSEDTIWSHQVEGRWEVDPEEVLASALTPARGMSRESYPGPVPQSPLPGVIDQPSPGVPQVSPMAEGRMYTSPLQSGDYRVDDVGIETIYADDPERADLIRAMQTQGTFSGPPRFRGHAFGTDELGNDISEITLEHHYQDLLRTSQGSWGDGRDGLWEGRDIQTPQAYRTGLATPQAQLESSAYDGGLYEALGAFSSAIGDLGAIPPNAVDALPSTGLLQGLQQGPQEHRAQSPKLFDQGKPMSSTDPMQFHMPADLRQVVGFPQGPASASAPSTERYTERTRDEDALDQEEFQADHLLEAFATNEPRTFASDESPKINLPPLPPLPVLAVREPTQPTSQISPELPALPQLAQQADQHFSLPDLPPLRAFEQEMAVVTERTASYCGPQPGTEAGDYNIGGLEDERQISTAEAQADALLHAATGFDNGMSDRSAFDAEMQASLRAIAMDLDVPLLPPFPEGEFRVASPAHISDLPAFPQDFPRGNEMVQNQNWQQPIAPVTHPFSPDHPEAGRPSSAKSEISASWSQAQHEDEWDDYTGSTMPHRQADGQLPFDQQHQATNENMVERMHPHLVTTSPGIWDSTNMFGSEDRGTRDQPQDQINSTQNQYQPQRQPQDELSEY